MRMTRFWIKKKEGINFVLRCLQSMQGSEIFIPKLPSMSIADLIKNIKKKVKIKKINILGSKFEKNFKSPNLLLRLFMNGLKNLMKIEVYT